MFVVTLLLLLMVAFLAALAWLANEPAKGLALAGVVALLAITFSAAPLFLMGALVLVLWGVRMLGPTVPREYRILAGASFAMALIWPTLQVLATWHAITALRRDYPIESFEKRLAYEPAPPDRSKSIPLPAAIEVELHRYEDSFEGPAHYSSRRTKLMRLHRSADAELEKAIGFGDQRMPSLSRTGIPQLQVPSAQLLPDYGQFEATEEFAIPHADGALVHHQIPEEVGRELHEAHEAGLRDFLKPDRFGWVAAPRSAAGFESHAMSDWLHDPAVKDLEARYAVVRLELVSVVRHDPPQAYPSRSLPRMDELIAAPLRPLDSFEQRALPQLAAQDLVIETKAGVVRMLGSIRASQGCLECHHVRRGELLGAFSYELWSRHVGLPPQRSAASAAPGL